MLWSADRCMCTALQFPSPVKVTTLLGVRVGDNLGNSGSIHCVHRFRVVYIVLCQSPVTHRSRVLKI